MRGGDVAAVGSIPEAAPPMAMWNTYVWVESADETASKVRDAGGGVVMEPFDVMDAGRMAVFTDPEGAVFCVWQAKEHKGAQVVNEHGSLNFNGLNTRDVDGAKSFYGSVFGWTTLDAAAAAPRCGRCPATATTSSATTPASASRWPRSGGPEGFEDVVASINPIPDDQPDTPPHWSVTFAVDDADATAAKATELGGKVIVPPFDAPWVRMTVIERSAGRDVHRQQVRAGEQGPRQLAAAVAGQRCVPQGAHVARRAACSAGAGPACAPGRP